jgi:hypothetical protein
MVDLFCAVYVFRVGGWNQWRRRRRRRRETMKVGLVEERETRVRLFF